MIKKKDSNLSISVSLFAHNQSNLKSAKLCHYSVSKTTTQKEKYCHFSNRSIVIANNIVNLATLQCHFNNLLGLS